MGASDLGGRKRSSAWQLKEAFHHTAKAAFCPQGANRIHQPPTNPPSRSCHTQACTAPEHGGLAAAEFRVRRSDRQANNPLSADTLLRTSLPRAHRNI